MRRFWFLLGLVVPVLAVVLYLATQRGVVDVLLGLVFGFGALLTAFIGVEAVPRQPHRPRRASSTEKRPGNETYQSPVPKPIDQPRRKRPRRGNDW